MLFHRPRTNAIPSEHRSAFRRRSHRRNRLVTTLQPQASEPVSRLRPRTRRARRALQPGVTRRARRGWCRPSSSLAARPVQRAPYRPVTLATGPDALAAPRFQGSPSVGRRPSTSAIHWTHEHSSWASEPDRLRPMGLTASAAPPLAGTYGPSHLEAGIAQPSQAKSTTATGDRSPRGWPPLPSTSSILLSRGRIPRRPETSARAFCGETPSGSGSPRRDGCWPAATRISCLPVRAPEPQAARTDSGFDAPRMLSTSLDRSPPLVTGKPPAPSRPTSNRSMGSLGPRDAVGTGVQRSPDERAWNRLAPLEPTRCSSEAFSVEPLVVRRRAQRPEGFCVRKLQRLMCRGTSRREPRTHTSYVQMKSRGLSHIFTGPQLVHSFRTSPISIDF